MNTPSHSTAHWGSAQQLAPMAPPWGHPTLNTVPSGGPRCRRPELGSCPPHLVHTPCQLHTPAGLSRWGAPPGHRSAVATLRKEEGRPAHFSDHRSGDDSSAEHRLACLCPAHKRVLSGLGPLPLLFALHPHLSPHPLFLQRPPAEGVRCVAVGPRPLASPREQKAPEDRRLTARAPGASSNRLVPRF